ncbi:chaperonin 10-like protein [Phyllosticta citribraziliensis]|uniref:Chaperonin 10-like protein n=1 Tax=Phyllosticta citribraziliensis TaxID=989973 RepID=A0ABR1L302_9PEZI
MAEPISTRAIVCRKPIGDGEGWQMETVRLREIEDDELVVRIVASGICHTDVTFGSLTVGTPFTHYPSVKGHEGSGYVERVGPKVTVAQPGDPVLLSYAFCETCAICKAGHPAHCVVSTPMNFLGYDAFFSEDNASETPDLRGGFFSQSSFANWTIVKQHSVVNVKGTVSDADLRVLAPLGCGIQTGSASIVHLTRPGPNDSVLVLGLGGVGLSAIMGAKLQGCTTIIGVDRLDSRLRVARELGATHTIDTSNMDNLDELVKQVQALTDGYGAAVTIEATGAMAIIRKGLAMTRFAGKYVQVGVAPFGEELSFEVFPHMTSGRHIIGTVEGDATPSEFVPKMVAWFKGGRFPVDKLVRLYRAEEWHEAVRDMELGKTVKAVITW